MSPTPVGALALLAALSSAAAETTDAIRVNQVGYQADAPKLAIIVTENAANQFSVHRIADGKAVYQGTLSSPVLDKDSGDQVRIAEFTAVTLAGRYELRVPGVGESVPFEVETRPYGSLLRLVTRSYYGQRCGTAVDLGGGYAHPACHRQGAFHESSGRVGKAESHHGWHDAGDYGRYMVNSGIAVGTLLWSWELFPETFSDLGLDIPESSNATPDLLDEVRWNLEWMLAMQDTDGGAWHKQTSKRFPPFVHPHEDRTVSYVIGTGSEPYKGSCATANLAAVSAIAARVYRPFDEKFSDRSLAASRRAWSWLDRYPTVTFRNPPGVETGEYGDRDCRDERLWAAVELWRTGADAAPHEYFLANIDEAVGAIGATTAPSWQETGALAAWSYVMSGKGQPAAVEAIRIRTLSAASEIVRRSRAHPYRIPLVSADYLWGSNAVVANYGLQLLIANEIKPDPAFVDSALEILHYLVGRNTFSLSWITGAGSRAVRNPHHRPSGSDRNAEPWPGLLAGGPNRHRQDPPLRRLPRNTPPARLYLDEQESFSSNEVAINWNAALVFLISGVEAAADRP